MSRGGWSLMPAAPWRMRWSPSKSGPVHPDLAAGTGPDGGFLIGNLAIGRYMLRADAEGFAPGFAEVVIVAGRRVEARIQVLRMGGEDETDDFFDQVSEELGGNETASDGYER